MDTPQHDEVLPERAAAVVALKALPESKSRMASLPGPVRQRLARCMALDTVAALSPTVDEVLVVSDQPDLPAALKRHGLVARVITEPPPAASNHRSSLNHALAHGDALLHAAGVARVLACVGDLPALRTASVRRVLAAADRQSRAFLPDHDERGTTMLIAWHTPLDPCYGTEIIAGRELGSAERHRRSGAQPLSLGDLPDARWDVDTVADLRVAHRLGLGPATAGLVDPASGSVGDYCPVEVVGVTGRTITVRADGPPETVVRSRYDGDPAHLVPGRGLHAVRVAGALRCWA